MIFQISITVSNLVTALKEWGFLDFVLPFILIFGITFALLEKLGIFGERKYNTVIAVAIGLLITIPHALYPQPNDAVSIIQKYLPEFVFLALAMVLVLMLLGMVGGTPVTGIITALLGIAAVGYFLISVIRGAAGYELPFTFLKDPNFIAVMIVILVFGIVVYYVAGPTEKTEWGKWLDEFLGRGTPPAGGGGHH